MSPYRRPSLQPSANSRDQSDRGRGLGIMVTLGSAQMILVFCGARLYLFAIPFVLGVVVGARMALRGKSRGAHARLVRLTRHRGRWLVAALLAIGFVAPRCSPKRLARYRAINRAKVIEVGIPDPFAGHFEYRLTKKIIEKSTS